jgi:hypothetical protein
MPTMTLSPDSVSDERTSIVNASKSRSSAAVDLVEREAGLSTSAEAGPAMTEDDTVCVLAVLAEMQRIIDRHLEKTGQTQPKS